MTTKYPMPKQHIHAELIKAWADDYRCIETGYGGVWFSRYNPDFDDDDVKFRINPISDYALAKITELGGDDMVEMYLYWLDGGETLCHFCKQVYFTPQPNQDPFSEFVKLLNNYDNITKKKRMVKQVLWVAAYEHPNIVKDCFFLDEGVEPSNFPKGYTVHKVPSCTREVEANE